MILLLGYISRVCLTVLLIIHTCVFVFISLYSKCYLDLIFVLCVCILLLFAIFGYFITFNHIVFLHHCYFRLRQMLEEKERAEKDDYLSKYEVTGMLYDNFST